jgi:nucleotide-binding universal stress UspA family protein
VDLLVVGSCSRGFVGRVLVGNDTRAALAGSPCAVAVAPLGYLHDMGRLSTIGVGFDGSPESRQALGLATELAARHGASLRLLSVVQIPGTPWATGAAVAWGSALEDLLGDAQRAIDELASRAPAGSPPLRGESVVGVPGEELAEFGERVDLLVVGSRGYGPVRRLMVGSTSEHLASHARCPLLVLPRGVGAAGEGGGESHHP